MTSETTKRVQMIVGGALGMTLMTALRGRFGPALQELAVLIAMGVGLYVLWSVVRRLFEPDTAEAIRRWHPGQLALSWLMVAVVAFMLKEALSATPMSTTRSVLEPCPVSECPLQRNLLGAYVEQTKWVRIPEPHPTGDKVALVLAVLLFVVLPGGTLATTWVWFGGRQR